ncbi:MAG: DUF4421 domain-containing protein [Bacteroidota bacterium]
MKLPFVIAASVGILLIFTDGVSAQKIFSEESRIKYDTNYIQVYKDELTTRMFLSRKQTGYSLSDKYFTPRLAYNTNPNLLMGVGYTYSFLTLNLAVKLPFLNGDDDIYGESKYIDLQSHTIFRSYILDFYLQWHKGFYVSNPDELFNGWEPGQPYPTRGDLRTNIVGVNIQYLFNSDRYSYKASFVQNEFQKRSAGSPIVGIESYWMLGMGDSLLIPGSITHLNILENYVPFNQVDMFNVGVNGGYAYTFVMKQRIYLSASFIVGIAGGKSWFNYTPTSETQFTGISLGLNNTSRISVGYNRNDFYIGMSYRRFSMSNLADLNNGWIAYSTGNLRLNVVKRFKLKRSIKILRPDLWIL